MPFSPWAMTSTPPAESRRYLSSSRASRSSSTMRAVIGIRRSLSRLSEYIRGGGRPNYGRRRRRVDRGSWPTFPAASGLKGAQAGGHVIRGQTMSAVNAVDVGNAHATIAIAAGRGDLVGALRTEMELSMNTGPTGGAARDYRL